MWSCCSPVVLHNIATCVVLCVCVLPPVPHSSHMGVWKGLFRVELDIPIIFCTEWSEMTVSVPSLDFLWWFAILISPCIGQWLPVADLIWIPMVIQRLKQSPDVNFQSIYLLAEWQTHWDISYTQKFLQVLFSNRIKDYYESFSSKEHATDGLRGDIGSKDDIRREDNSFCFLNLLLYGAFN